MTGRVGASTAPSVVDQYRLLAEHAIDVVVQTDLNRMICWVAPNVDRTLGWIPSQLVGTLLVDLVHPEDRARAQADCPRSGAAPLLDATTPFLMRFRTAAGEYLWMSGTDTVVTDPITAMPRIITGMRNVDDLIAARDAFRDGEVKYRLLAENASDIVTLITPDGVLEWISPSVRQILSWDPDDLVGSRPWGLVHPDDLDAAAHSFAEASLPDRPPPPIALRLRAKDGSYVWLSAIGHRSDKGRFVVSYRRVEDQVRAQRAHTESEERYRLLAENAQDMVFSLDVKAVIQWVSPSSVALLGYEPNELVGQFGGILIKPDDLPTLLETATEAREGHPSTCRIRLVAKDGTDRWVQATPRALRDDAGALIGGVIGVRDIHDEILARDALQHEVDFDDLTGLAKRPLALARIQEVLDTRNTAGWALLCVGVNGMTAANQAYTYAAGDAILRSVAAQLVEATGQEDRVARIAGDEFAVVLRDVITATDAVNAAERILAAIRGSVSVGEARVDVTACLGVAFWDGQSADALMRDATAAMRQAAAKGTNRWEFLDGDAGAHARETLVIQTSLAEDLPRGRVRPWLMPIARLDDGKVVGYEALARWERSDGVVWDAASFIGIAEHTGLIMRIDHAMLRGTLDLIPRLAADRHVAVNVSAATLASDDFAAFVMAELARVGVDPARLHLEVTETSLLLVSDRIRVAMEELAAQGITWWVDDFGTGFSSISHLRDLPISGVKLDMSFTRALSQANTHATKLARGLAGLAAGLDLATIAEGVETIDQVRVLSGQGWQLGQGGLFGLATPVALAGQ